MLSVVGIGSVSGGETASGRPDFSIILPVHNGAAYLAEVVGLQCPPCPASFGGSVVADRTFRRRPDASSDVH